MPFGVAAAAGIGAIGSIIGGSNAASAATSAANTEANAATAASNAELSMFNKTQANLAPWMTAGGNALSALQYGLGIGPGPGGGGAPTSPAGLPPNVTPTAGSGPGGVFNFNGQSIPIADIVAAGQNQGAITQAIQNSALGGNMPGNGPTSLTPAQQAWMQLTNGGNNPLPASFTAQASAAPAAAGAAGAAPNAAPSSAVPGGFGSLTRPFAVSDVAASGLYPELKSLGVGPDGTFNPSTFANSPGYQFQLKEGENAVLNNAAATGGVGGNALRDLTSFGQGLASTNYQNYLGDYLNTYNNIYSAYTGNQKQIYDMLSGLSGSGQNAAANLGGFATTVGGQVGSNLIGAGNASAAGTVGSANAWNSAIGGVGNNALLGYAMSNGNLSWSNPNWSNIYSQAATDVANNPIF